MIRDYRCPRCGCLLFKSDADDGTIQTFCRHCRAIRSVVIARKDITAQTRRSS